MKAAVALGSFALGAVAGVACGAAILLVMAQWQAVSAPAPAVQEPVEQPAPEPTAEPTPDASE